MHTLNNTRYRPLGVIQILLFLWLKESNLNYLFNADKVVIKKALGGTDDVTSLYKQQVNKCIRAIKSHAGKELEESSVDKSSKEITSFIFSFPDGSQKSVKLTEQYIQYGNKYYSISGRGKPEQILQGLFTAYF